MKVLRPALMNWGLPDGILRRAKSLKFVSRVYDTSLWVFGDDSYT